MSSTVVDRAKRIHTVHHTAVRASPAHWVAAPVPAPRPVSLPLWVLLLSVPLATVYIANGLPDRSTRRRSARHYNQPGTARALRPVCNDAGCGQSKPG